MTHELERKLVYLGSYESGLHHLTIPRALSWHRSSKSSTPSVNSANGRPTGRKRKSCRTFVVGTG